jgi:polygalacturonase
MTSAKCIPVALCCLTALLSCSSVLGETVDVRSAGAKGDGKTVDTAAINRAIDDCAKAGGGQVRFPGGRYLTSTINLKSHVHLWLEAGATIVGVSDPEVYSSFSTPKEAPESRFGSRWHRALIIGDSVEDVSIQGPGIIDGNKVFDARGEERMRGPHTILLGNSKDVLVRDVSIRDSANYAVLMEGCDDMRVQGVRITGGWDGVHFRGWPGRPCKRISITDCQMYTGDDSIAGRYWEDTLISGCVLNSSCNGIRLIGPAVRLTIHACLIYGPGVCEHRSSHRNNMLAGLCLQPGAWDRTSGAMEQVNVSDITMHNVTTPLFCVVKPGNTADGIRISRLTATGAYLTASSVECWADAPMRNVTLSDVSIAFSGQDRGNQNAVVKGPGVDGRPLPAWGLYARHVENLRLDNVRFTRTDGLDLPALLCEDVNGLSLDGLRRPENASAVEMKHVERLSVRDVIPPLPTPGPPP